MALFSLSGILILFLIFLPTATLAAVAFDFGLNDLQQLGLGGADIRVIIVRLIRVALSFLGIIAVIIVLYGGYLWMTSAGNQQRIELAKNVLKNGLIGLVIILSAYAIVAFIIGTFVSEILNRGGVIAPPGPCINCSALGGGIIEDHYPGRNATGIPRNAVHISITFKEPIYVDATNARSFISAAAENPLRPGNWTGTSNDNVFTLREGSCPATASSPIVMTAVTNDGNQRLFTLYPTAILGYPDHDTKYCATVKGNAAGLAKKADLGWNMGGDYNWEFTVSTFLDTTPPKVIDVYPVDGQTEARNVSVVMTFSEPIDPVSIVYAVGSNNTILFHQTPPNADVDGAIEVANSYRTVTFRTKVECGVNSCGQPIYCFEANAAINGIIRAATLISDNTGSPPACDTTTVVNSALVAQGNPSLACVAPNASTLFFNGIVDMAGNSLDGSPGAAPAPPLPSGDGTADGPAGDNYTWAFNTDDTIVKAGPKIVAIDPTNEAAGVGVDDPAKGTFNRRLLNFTTDDFRFYENGASFSPRWARQSIQYDCGVSGEACFPPSQRKVCSGGSRDGQNCAQNADCSGGSCLTVRVCRGGTNDRNACIADSDCAGGECPIASCPPPVPPEERNECGRTTAELYHGTFAEDQAYEPRIGSTVLDVYQNCYTPSYGPFICNGGSRQGLSCSVPPNAADCPGGTCVNIYNNLGETGLGADQ